MARSGTSRVLHISKEGQATSFICGRKITSAYEVCDAHPPVFCFLGAGSVSEIFWNELTFVRGRTART